MTDKERIIKVFTLILESDETQRSSSGICFAMSNLLRESKITSHQYFTASNYVDKFFFKFCNKECYPWYWKKYNWVPRRRWMREQIKTLSK